MQEAIMVRSNAEKESIPQPHLNVLLAQSYYLEALAKGDFRPVEEAGELFIKAYKLKSDTIRYKERAAMAYHQKKDDAEASRLVDEILEQDEFNPKAWNILLLLEPGVAVPTEVQKNPMFKVGELHRIAQANSRLKLSDFETLFVYELETRPPVTKLDRTVLFYWTYVAQYVMHYFFERSGRRLDLQKPHELIGDPDLTYARDIFLQIDKFVKGTEFADHAMFQVARFDLLYCQYFLTDDAEVDQRLTGELFQLFVGSPQNSVSKLLWGDLDPISKVIPQRILDLLSILYSQGQGERMLEAIDALPEALTPMVFLFRGLAFSILKRKPDAIEAYRQFLLQTIEIDDFDACNILTVIQTLIREGQKTEDIEKWRWRQNILKLHTLSLC
ncbi:hypothetical protein GO730_39055 [Spirosoma sp. HMF3257]|uniref:Tetratricopeptide repeat protein n=1 Tax=Spirosoma telluris TaxID=2183553 RepID=A0A327NF64_9BACT|nr:hypothetical protein [Spirosoma telluris]RAI72889.1 hypothetical protein HMF3257_38970 [Spirosoma telluris]